MCPSTSHSLKERLEAWVMGANRGHVENVLGFGNLWPSLLELERDAQSRWERFPETRGERYWNLIAADFDYDEPGLLFFLLLDDADVLLVAARGPACDLVPFSEERLGADG